MAADFEAVLARKERGWEVRLREMYAQISKEKEDFKLQQEYDIVHIDYDEVQDLKREVADLKNRLGVTEAEAETYKKDFEDERADRERAHHSTEEMKMEYDRTVHEKTIELEEFRLASEEIIEGLTNQLKDVSKDQDQLKMKNESLKHDNNLLKKSLIDMKEHSKRTPSEQQQHYSQLPSPTDRPLDPQPAALTHSHSTGCRMHDKQHQAMKLDYDQYSDNDPPLQANVPPPFSHSPFTNHHPEMHNYSISHSPLPGVVPIPFASERASSLHRRPVSPVTSKYSSPEPQGSNDTTSYRYQTQPSGSRSPPPSGYQLYEQPRPRKIHYQDQQLTNHNLAFSQPPEVKPSPFQPVDNCSPPLAQSPRPIYDQRFNHSPPLSQPLQLQCIPNQSIHDHSPPPLQLQCIPIHDRSPPPHQPLEHIPNQSIHDRSPPVSQPHQPLEHIPNQSIHDHSPPLSQPHQLQRIPNQSMHDRSPPLSQPHQLQRIPNQSIHDRSPPVSQPHQLQRTPNHSMHDLSPPLTQSPGPIYDQASRSPLRKEPRLPFYYNLPLDEDVQHQLQQSSYYQNLPEGSFPLEYDSGTMHVPAAEPVNTHTPYGQNAHYSPPPVPSPLNYRPQGNVQQASMYEYHGNRQYSTEEESSTLPEGQPLDDYYRRLKLEGASNGKQTFKEAISSSANRETPTEQPQARRMGDMTVTQTPSGKTENIGGEADENIDLEFNSEIDETSLKQNFLERNLDDEIFHFNEDFSRDRAKQETNEKSLYDSNLICRFCSKVHRIGEIQKFKRHYAECKAASMKNSEEPSVLDAKSMPEQLAGDTQPLDHLQFSSQSHSFSELDEKQLNAFKRAVESKQTRKHIIMQAIFHGNSRSGKTSLCKVIQGKKADPSEPSTGVMDKPVHIELTQSTVVVDGLTWTPVDDLGEETVVLVQGVTPVVPVGVDTAKRTAEPGTTSYQTSPLRTGIHSAAAPNSPSTLKPSRPIKREIDKMFKKAARKAGVKMKNFKNPWTLYLSDIGGQLEFQELLPALTNGPSLHIVVIRASRGLSSKFEVEYLHKNGQSAHSYTADYTARDELLISLATIMSTGRAHQLPKVIVVLTFSDKITEEELTKMDKDLQEAVKNTEAFKSGVIVFAEEGRLCHPINNLDPNEADLHGIRSTVERIGRHNKEYNFDTPYSWQYFGIALRELPDTVLSYDSCLDMARECEIEEKEEVDAALKFLHDVGVIRHFNKVPELCDLVFKEPQMLFDNVTELVIKTFTFGHCDDSTLEEFKKKGIFPAEMVTKLSTGSDLLTPSKFEAFLKHHHIIAPLKEGGVVTKYFLPCSLVHAPVQDTDTAANSDTHTALIITFESGYTPRGLFGCLATNLLNEKPDDEFSLVLDEENIYRNQITLSVGPYSDKFRFSVSPTFVRLDVFPSLLDRKIPLSTICCFVRDRVCHGLDEIVEDLNYNFNARHSLALLCPCVADSKDPHPAIITLHKREPHALKCTVSKAVKCLPKGHEIWFNKQRSPILKIDSDLRRVKGYIWEARTQWKNIGRALGISDGTIRSIRESDDGESLHQILTHWIQSGTATIQDLLTALEDPTVGRRDIAHELRSRKI